MTAMQSSKRELDFTGKGLAIDAKNYHTWAYRHWALGHFFKPGCPNSKAEPVASTSTAAEDELNRDAVWSGEVAYAERLIDEDVRNNSAWNHRFFARLESGMFATDDKLFDEELRSVLLPFFLYSRLTIVSRYTKSKIALSPNNPSAWNYLRG